MCPFVEFGCAFKHEESPECFYEARCKKRLCQYKHTIKSTSNIINIYKPTEEHSEPLNDSGEIANIAQFKYDSSNILCEHYCASWELSGGGYHIDTKDEFKELKGVHVNHITEEYDNDIEDFVKTYYPCNIC